MVRNLCGVEKKVDERLKKNVFRWYGRVARMDEAKMSSEESMAE